MSHRREQKDARKAEKAFEDYKATFDPAEAPDGEWFTCSLKQEHDETCFVTPEDHEARINYGIERLHTREGKELLCATVTRWDVGIMIEREQWAKANLDTSNVQFDIYGMDIRVSSVIEALTELLGVDVEDLNNIYRKNLYNKLRQDFQAFAPAVAENRRRQQIALPGPGINGIPPGIVDQFGRKLGGDM